MRNLVFVFAALAIAPACTTVDTAVVTANWEFDQVDTVNPGAPPALLPCPDGFDRAEVHLTSLTGGTDYIDTYPCGQMSGTEAYDPDLYNIELLITGPGGVYAVSPSEGLPAVEIDTRDVDKTVNFSIADNGGYFGFAWNLIDSQNGNAPITCGDAAADSVEIIATMTTGSFALGDRYPCEDGSVVTPAYPEGSYTVSAAALNTADEAIGPVENKTAVMGDRNEFVNLGTVTLSID